MIRKSLLLIAWFPLAFSLLGMNMFLLTMHAKGTGDTPKLSAEAPTVDPHIQLAAPGRTSQVLGTYVIAGDSRGLLLQKFLERYHSPMYQYADLIVEEADKNHIDFRLITAIAMCESNLGKRVPKRSGNNAWGLAVYTNADVGSQFPDWPAAIRWVSKYVRTKYYDRGITDIYDIGAIWAPPSVENGHSWANCVSKFQEAII